jgi:hypothetical protein
MSTKTITLKCIQADKPAERTGYIYSRKVLEDACASIQDAISKALVTLEFTQSGDMSTNKLKTVGIIKALTVTKAGHYRIKFEYSPMHNKDLVELAKMALDKKLAHITPVGVVYGNSNHSKNMVVGSLNIRKFVILMNGEKSTFTL